MARRNVSDSSEVWFPDKAEDNKEAKSITPEEAEKMGRPLERSGYYLGMKEFTKGNKKFYLAEFQGAGGAKWGVWASTVLRNILESDVPLGTMTWVKYLGKQKTKDGENEYKAWSVDIDDSDVMVVRTSADPVVRQAARGDVAPSDEDMGSAPAPSPGPHNDDDESELPF